MSTSDFWQHVSETVSSSAEWAEDGDGSGARASQRSSRVWILADILTVILSTIVVNGYRRHFGWWGTVRGLFNGDLFHGRGAVILALVMASFTVLLLWNSRRLHLYTPFRLASFLHEQRMSFQACFTSGLLLAGAMYVIELQSVARSIALGTIALTTIGLGVRRLIYRMMMYRRFERGQDARNVLIVGTGPEAHALRHHLESIRHLGYTFKGFIELPGTGTMPYSSDVVGSLDTLFQQARKQFIDEIFFTSPCERGVVQDALEKARIHGVDLRLIPEMYGGLVWNNPIEYVGQFPTVPLHRGRVPEVALVLKRTLDILFSTLMLVLLSPLLVGIAIAIKLDSPGPVFYLSDRIGKKGCIFRCVKFRTMVRDAETRRSEVVHMNERDGVLFKVAKDPRVTRVGRFLRKYSLDELPQFLNVLGGDMSVVGPRPPIASEVQEYKLNHLRRLDVTPGITGLWQVQGRQDPSFDSYVSLDVNYIENWSLWLDLKIILRTVGVVFAGTGS